MRNLSFALTLALAACATAPSTTSTTMPVTYSAEMAPALEPAAAQAILNRTQRLHLAPDVSALTPGEREAVRELLAAGERLHRLYMLQRHPQALEAEAYLAAHPERTVERDLFRLSSGPIVTTLDNERAPLLTTIAREQPARNVYPAGATKAAIDAFMATHPERAPELQDDRSVVWADTAENRRAVIARLTLYPALDTLHPGLRARMEAAPVAGGYFGVPYSVAYADEIMFVSERLNAAADDVESGDPAFARYLRLRARDLLADDYEGGDAAWVSSDFTGNLNAQIGSYETYDDALYGVKTFFSLSLLVRDRARSEELQEALQDIQRVENALPYSNHREVRSDIPVGVYNIIADFGQARVCRRCDPKPSQ